MTENKFLVELDDGAARLICAAAGILAELDVPLDIRPDRCALTFIRAAGWLIGFTGTGEETVETMLEAYIGALRTAATDPLRGELGAELTQMMTQKRKQ